MHVYFKLLTSHRHSREGRQDRINFQIICDEPSLEEGKQTAIDLKNLATPEEFRIEDKPLIID